MIEATLAILNANIITLNPKQPKATSIAIRDEKITAVGSNREIRKYIGDKTQVLDAKTKTIVPGLVDSHVHMTGFGKFLQTLNLRNVDSIKKMQRRLQEYANEKPGKSWILGGRWDQERFAEKRYPTRHDLDAAVNDKPVLLTRVCGHLAVANSRALELAGITRNTTIMGGKIDLDNATGEPNGILRENALEHVQKAVPKLTPEELEETCLLACRKAVEAGLTGVHWIVSSAEEIHALQKLSDNGKLPLRVYLGIPVELLDELINLGLLSGFGNDMIKIGFVKIFADGSLGARTAALQEPYSDKSETRGILLYEQNDLNRLVSKAHEADLQLGIHAIGDRAIEAVLEAFSMALKASPRKDHRHRIEHCSVLNQKLIKDMKSLNIIASVQPHFIVSDFWVGDRLGKTRTRWVYPFKELMDRGLVVASGSDCPVELINPLLGIWAIMTKNGFTLEEALRTYTLNAAYASFDEVKKGTIEPGKLADLTIFYQDLRKVSPDKIKHATIDMTIVDGKIVYHKD